MCLQRNSRCAHFWQSSSKHSDKIGISTANVPSWRQQNASGRTLWLQDRILTWLVLLCRRTWILPTEETLLELKVFRCFVSPLANRRDSEPSRLIWSFCLDLLSSTGGCFSCGSASLIVGFLVPSWTLESCWTQSPKVSNKNGSRIKCHRWGSDPSQSVGSFFACFV